MKAAPRVTVADIIKKAATVLHRKRFIKGQETQSVAGTTFREYAANAFAKVWDRLSWAAKNEKAQEIAYNDEYVGGVCAIGAIKVAAHELGVPVESDIVHEAVKAVTETARDLIRSHEIVVGGDDYELAAADIGGIEDVNDEESTKKGTIKTIFARTIEKFA